MSLLAQELWYFAKPSTVAISAATSALVIIFKGLLLGATIEEAGVVDAGEKGAKDAEGFGEKAAKDADDCTNADGAEGMR
jgi:hypothetical protein